MTEMERKEEDLNPEKATSTNSQDDAKGLFADPYPQISPKDSALQVTIKFLRHEKSQLEEMVKKKDSMLKDLNEKKDLLTEELNEKKELLAAKNEVIKAKNENLYEKKSFETIQKILVTIGSAMLGFLSMIQDYVVWFIFLILGLLLVISGLFFPSKMMFKNSQGSN